MKVLALETATDACSCALSVDGEQIWRHQHAPRRHAELILGMARELLLQAGLCVAGLDGIAFGRGPGSFTGVRIAAGVTQGLAFGADLPVAPVSSLQALAQGALREHEHAAVLTALDARMSEVYWGSFRSMDGGLMAPVGPETVCSPHGVEISTEVQVRWLGVGPGWARYESVLRACVGENLQGIEAERLPHACDVAALGVRCLAEGEGVSADAALPVYLRDRVTR